MKLTKLIDLGEQECRDVETKVCTGLVRWIHGFFLGSEVPRWGDITAPISHACVSRADEKNRRKTI